MPLYGYQPKSTVETMEEVLKTADLFKKPI